MRIASDFDKRSVFNEQCRLSQEYDGKSPRRTNHVTSKTILIGLGGTGARVAEAALMLSMAGVGPSSLSVMLIDSDGAHGNGERTAQALTRYHRFRQLWSSGAHGIDYSADDAPDLGRAAVEPILPQGRWQWSPPPECASLSVLADGVPKPLLDALFLPNAKEAQRQVQHGLGGRAHVGAAVFGGLFADAANPVVRCLREAMVDGASIVMVGSGFGGSSVGAMMALHATLRDTARRGGSIGAMLLPPYFDNGEDFADLRLRQQLAVRSLMASGVAMLPTAATGVTELPHHGRSGRGQCNPSMVEELTASARILAHLSGAESDAHLPSGTLNSLRHLIRLSHFSLYETQVRLRAKGGIFTGNWAMALAGKFDPSLAGEHINLLADISRRVLEWAGSVEIMAGEGAPNLGWHIAPMGRNAMPITDAPRQGVQMIHPASLTPAQIAAAFDHLIDADTGQPNFSSIAHRLRRKPTVAGHNGMARALVAAHRVLGEGGAL